MSRDKLNYSIAVQVTDEELERSKLRVKALKRKYGVTRTEVLKMIIVDYLDDEDIIKVLMTKGNLKKKPLRCRKLKKF